MLGKEVLNVPANAGTSFAPYPSTRFDRWVLGRIQKFVETAPIRFVLWDGFELPSASGSPVATMLFKERSALYGWMWDPELNFGETYMSGLVEIQGDLLALLEAIYRSFTRPRRPWWLWQKSNDILRREKRPPSLRHRQRLLSSWLDEHMVYTCAYFPTPETAAGSGADCEDGSRLPKLQLKPGEHVIEAGCGWGSLALFMARQYGVMVRAFNISSEQIAYARRRAAAEGLADRVEFVQDDYRHVQGSCDAFVSVGMLEHVGAADYSTLGRVIDRSLSKSGRRVPAFHRPRQPGAAQSLDSKAHLPRRVRADAA